MPEMEKQILALREAFSADITKPFELKVDFAGSPHTSDQSSSPMGTQIATTTPPTDLCAQIQHSTSYLHHPSVTSASFIDAEDYPRSDSTSLGVGNMEPGHYYQDMQHQSTDLLFTNEIQWNPAPIFQ